MSRHRRPGRLIAGAIVVLAGCAAASNASLWPEASQEPPRTTVRVENQSFDRVQIYAVRNGIALRLGTVSSQAVEEFELPRAIAQLGETQLLVRPTGSASDHTTDTILFSAGDQIDWQIRNVLSLSSYSVSPRRGK